MPGLTIGDPVTLSKALSSHWVLPGDEIVLLPGTYTATEAGINSGTNNPGKGVFQVKLHGTAEAKITIRPQIKGTVRINGGIEINGGEASYIILRDLEIAPTPTSRTMPRASLDFPYCVWCNAVGCDIINNYIHDGIEGLEWFGPAPASGVVEGNIMINCGWFEEATGGHGAGIYTHNNPGGQAIIEHNIFNSPGEVSAAMWSASANAVQDYVFRENVAIKAALNCACEDGVCNNNLIINNHIFDAALRMGRDNPQNGTIEAYGNRAYWVYDALLLWWQLAANIHDNVFVSGNRNLVSYYEAAGAENVLDNNDYYYTGSTPYYVNEQVGGVAWSHWTDTLGYDVHSQTVSGKPTTNEVFVYANDEGGALVVVWNWQGLDGVSVDFSTISLASGAYRWRQAMDPIGDTGEFTHTGDPVVFDMQAANHSTAEMAGHGVAFDSTFPTFGAFVVEKVT